MDKIVEKTLLFDFYGELLTEHQRAVYEDVVFNDMSLSEAADEYGVSRQGIHDMLKRCDKILQSYEDRLHMIAQFEGIRKTILHMKNILTEAETVTEESRRELIALTEQLSEELE